mmetsp:Transcript_13464/g.42606  ORF Transcript_13464/g.42606 Transcript_13464/m.42606 type:complete len:207 (+) Transcript_13464:756-1376(+)
MHVAVRLAARSNDTSPKLDPLARELISGPYISSQYVEGASGSWRRLKGLAGSEVASPNDVSLIWWTTTLPVRMRMKLSPGPPCLQTRCPAPSNRTNSAARHMCSRTALSREFKNGACRIMAAMAATSLGARCSGGALSRRRRAVGSGASNVWNIAITWRNLGRLSTRSSHGSLATAVLARLASPGANIARSPKESLGPKVAARGPN